MIFDHIWVELIINLKYKIMKPIIFLFALMLMFGACTNQEGNEFQPTNSKTTTDLSDGDDLKGPDPDTWLCGGVNGELVISGLNYAAENYSYPAPQGVCTIPNTVTSTAQFNFNFQYRPEVWCAYCSVNLSPHSTYAEYIEKAIEEAEAQIICANDLYITEISNFRFVDPSFTCNCLPPPRETPNCGNSPGFNKLVVFDITYRCCVENES